MPGLERAAAQISRSGTWRRASGQSGLLTDRGASRPAHADCDARVTVSTSAARESQPRRTLLMNRAESGSVVPDLGSAIAPNAETLLGMMTPSWSTARLDAFR